jgi:hypothetical protein
LRNRGERHRANDIAGNFGDLVVSSAMWISARAVSAATEGARLPVIAEAAIQIASQLAFALLASGSRPAEPSPTAVDAIRSVPRRA